jgi:acyl-CoA reductase-like NAD-dependent aldehyde dehydrogenase
LNEFVQIFRKTIESWYGSNPQTSDSYARVVAERHVTRIANMLNNRESGEIAFGGEIDVADRYIAPTLVTNVNINDKVLMGDEIFGPVLPVITYNSIDEAIGMINKR